VSRIVRAIVERIEDDGALGLSYSMLWTLSEADRRLGVLERGRVTAQLGRIAWKAGALETSREHYRRAEVLGRAARIPELQIRAWVGYSILARLRGNYPEVRKWGARAAHAASEAGLPALESLANHALMVSAAVAGDLDAALVYGWRVYKGEMGDREREAKALLHLSQVLLESGHCDVAARGFTAALALEPSARVALSMYGGLAMAAAGLRDAPGVRRAQAQAERLIATSGLPYESASTLLELSRALASIGEHRAALDCRDRGLAVARAHAYHELTHRLEALDVRAVQIRAEAPRAFDREGAEIARAVASLVGAGDARSH
jgi:tetratricopeptide (TPR) repeat protein